MTLAAANTANAQSTPAPANATPAASQLDEVVVVARRRSESLQDVPAAVTAFTSERVERSGVTKAADFIGQTSNVTLVETQNAGTSFIVIRGVSQARNSEPSVAVIVDGVQQVSPSQFNQELFDINQIEVLKGPQGGLYGRNAIGGAIVIQTKPPSDQLEGRIKVGVGNGPAYKIQGGLSGPLGGADNLKFRVGASYYDTKGYIPNTYLHENADPLREFSGHANLIWEATPNLTFDARGSTDLLHTQAFYFNVVNDGVNDVNTPVRVNNEGRDDRTLNDYSLKINYKTPIGSLTTITAYDTIREIATGDNYNFLPITQSYDYINYGFDLTQAQYLDVKALSQEIRFASKIGSFLQYTIGGYAVGTDRYISTSNLKDTGHGAAAIYTTPDANTTSFLADGQRNFAWAVFGNATANLTDKLELDMSLRFDSDKRRQTTDTPTAYLPNVPGYPQGFTGQVREKTFSEVQPKVTLRYKFGDPLMIYGGYSRGFRSGGFNQTGVAAIAAANGIVGIHDTYQAEVADTFEIGAKSELFERRLQLGAAVYTTDSKNGYFFYYLYQNSTQNLGNIPEARYTGFEIDATARPITGWDINLGLGYTDSDILKFPDKSVIGHQAPLVSQYTFNLGNQYRWSIADGFDGIVRVDYRRIGKTWFDVANDTVRNPVDLVDARLGVEQGKVWSFYLWSKNLTDKRYNAEYDPGGYLFKAEPRRFGVEFTRNF